ncbi:MAG: carboxypeptidase-like regulatory domain-containing protein [Propionibacteriaceae bacterium]|nr:carboxypeptidase-like regulatory domain-containing protein [Propionibacteriaceae bacterium]
MPETLTLTGTARRHDTTPLAAASVTATPSPATSRASDGSRVFLPADTLTDEAGRFTLTLVRAPGLRYLLTARAGGLPHRLGVLDCDSWPPGASIDIDDLPPVPTPLSVSAADDLRAWIIAQLAAHDPSDLTGVHARLDTADARLDGHGQDLAALAVALTQVEAAIEALPVTTLTRHDNGTATLTIGASA